MITREDVDAAVVAILAAQLATAAHSQHPKMFVNQARLFYRHVRTELQNERFRADEQLRALTPTPDELIRERERMRREREID